LKPTLSRREIFEKLKNDNQAIRELSDKLALDLV